MHLLGSWALHDLTSGAVFGLGVACTAGFFAGWRRSPTDGQGARQTRGEETENDPNTGRERAERSSESHPAPDVESAEPNERTSPTPEQLAYRALGLPDAATPRAVKSAYRKLALRWHPDQKSGDRAAHEKFLEIQGAYELLVASGLA